MKRIINRKILLYNNKPRQFFNKINTKDFNNLNININDLDCKIIVTMTSWPKRINNCKFIFESLLNQTKIPNRIYLNLSEEEFPKKEYDLPDDLINIIKNNDNIILNWISGENTKTMKKVFPILQFIDDNDIIITCDDDFIIPIDMIETRIKEFISSGYKPITSRLKNKLNSGYFCVFTKKMLKNWEIFLTDEIIKTYDDDVALTSILKMNGYEFITCKKYFKEKLKTFNEIESSHNNNVYDWKKAHELCNKRIIELKNKI